MVNLLSLADFSSHDIWDEYTRRQYRSKAPDRNPYGEDEEPKRFRDFDIFTRLRILHQLTVWTMWNPDRFREKMVDHQREVDQLEWVCFASMLVHSSMLTRAISVSKNLVMTKMIDNIISSTTIAFIDEPNHPFPLLPRRNRKRTQRRPLLRGEGKVSAEGSWRTRLTSMRTPIHLVPPIMRRNRRKMSTLPRLILSEATNGNASPSLSKTTKIYVSLLQRVKIPTRRC